MDKKRLAMLEKFVEERLPEAERDRVIIIVDKKPLTWKQVIEELKNGGDFANKVEETFEEMVR